MKAMIEVEYALRNGAQVVVLVKPVAAGKTAMGEALTRFAVAKTGLGLSGSATVANNNMLVDQIIGDTKGYVEIHRRDHYQCVNTGMSCAERCDRFGQHCAPRNGNHYHPLSCPYTRDLRAIRSQGARVVCNQHSYMGHRLYKPFAVFDEAHTLPDTIASMSATTLWRSNYQWPASFYSLSAVRDWLDSLDPRFVEGDDKLVELRGVLDGEVEGKCISLGEEELRGRDTEYVRVTPIDVSDSAGMFFPPSVERVVLMSATISRSDVEALGLDGRRVAYVSTSSPIPEQNRPAIHWPVASMAYGHREESFPKIIDAIVALAERHSNERGFVHTPYVLADELRAGLVHRLGKDRVRGHSRTGKQRDFDAWLSDRQPNSIFIGSGMAEGIDLAGSKANWQAVVAAPRKSLADPGMSWLAANRPDRYEWLSVRDTAQAYGRVCRFPTDYGATYFLDSSMTRELGSQWLPSWFPPVRTISSLSDLS